MRTRSELDVKQTSLAKNLERLDQVEELTNKLGSGFNPSREGLDIVINSTKSAGWTDISATLGKPPSGNSHFRKHCKRTQKQDRQC
ncbi:MAG: hypothetical protein R2688_03815 [Fimbriimonadaceae bacterium]